MSGVLLVPVIVCCEPRFCFADGTHCYGNPSYFGLVRLSDPWIFRVKPVLWSSLPFLGMQCCNVRNVVFTFRVLQSILLIRHGVTCELAVSQHKWWNHDSLLSVHPSSVGNWGVLPTSPLSWHSRGIWRFNKTILAKHMNTYLGLSLPPGVWNGRPGGISSSGQTCWV